MAFYVGYIYIHFMNKFLKLGKNKLNNNWKYPNFSKLIVSRSKRFIDGTALQMAGFVLFTG